MSRPIGLPKTGGRIKGTPNLRTLVLRESLNKVQFDVVQELCELYPQLEPEMRAKVLLSFLPYLFPKPESVPVTSLRTAKMQARADEENPIGSLDLDFGNYKSIDGVSDPFDDRE